ncbi:MAG: O-antigen ligase family protein [Anaerolineae bacterium]|nr:O-antigen ligase family protein [Anaerolineae bacterium]
MLTFNPVQEWIARLDRRTYALLVGLLLGLVGGGAGLLIVVAEPLLAFGAVFGLMAGLFIITNIQAALYGMIAVLALLPFGTFPIKIGFTPTLLDGAMGAFLLVYLLQWVRGKRTNFQTTPVHFFILIYMGWLILTFVLGLRYASPTSTDLRGFAETLLSIGMVFILVDFLRDPDALRRLVIAILVFVGLQALVTLVLYLLPDATAEAILVRLSRLGYPDGGVIRYIEDNRELAERAIGTWVDPNALGGVLAIASTIVAPQIFAARPVLRSRWLTFVVFGILALALFLTYSRASLLAFGAGLVVIGAFRYRKILLVMALVVVLVLLLPQTQPLVERFVDAFTAQDLATQMRIGEYTDSFRLISRYPVFGVGFTGTPDIDLYTDVASMYLIMANQIGLVGVAIFAIAMLSVFGYGLSAWKHVKHNPQLDSIFLGYYAALVAALVNAVADLYFFRLDFHASITLFWSVVALALASAHLALAEHESTVAKTRPRL